MENIYIYMEREYVRMREYRECDREYVVIIARHIKTWEI